MDNRFEYIWKHFVSVYQVPAGLKIAYGAADDGQVIIEPYTGDFFAMQEPWPQEISWQEWNGTQVPFLFTSQMPAQLISTAGGRVTIHFDIIAGAFYFLSGWQEYHSADRDGFGRFPYKSSLQHTLGIITLPVVNYYFDILKTAIEQALAVQIPLRLNPEAGFTVCMTHDIDNTESGWKADGRAALLQGRAGVFLKLLKARLKGRDSWFNWLDIARQVRQSGGISTFFFLCQQKPFQGTKNADYAIGADKYQAAVKALQIQGNEIAVHGSLEASSNLALLNKEKACLPGPIQGNRFHYLRFNPRQTPALLDAAGMAYDSSLGFAEHFGFRHGYCFPFWLYNFRKNKPFAFLEIPLILMDTTLDHPRYMRLKAGEVLPAIAPVLNEIRKFQGCFTVLWHNENFSRYKKNNGAEVFQQLITELNRRQVTFMTAGDIQQKFTSWRQEKPLKTAHKATLPDF